MKSEITEVETDITINNSRMRKTYKSIPEDCFNPYRDFRNDLFSHACLYPDLMTNSKKEDYLYRIRRKNQIAKRDRTNLQHTLK